MTVYDEIRDELRAIRRLLEERLPRPVSGHCLHKNWNRLAERCPDCSQVMLGSNVKEIRAGGVIDIEHKGKVR